MHTFYYKWCYLIFSSFVNVLSIKSEVRHRYFMVNENKIISDGQTAVRPANSLYECATMCKRASCCYTSYGVSTKMCIMDVGRDCCQVSTHANGWQVLRPVPHVPRGCFNCFAQGHTLYQIFYDDVEWNRAVSRCSNLGGKLLEIESECENNFINMHMQARIATAQGFWLGGYSYNQDGSFAWISNPNVTMTFLNFYPSEPNRPGAELCLEAFTHISFSWVDNVCNDLAQYICEFN